MQSGSLHLGVAAEIRAEAARQRITQAQLSSRSGIGPDTLKRRLAGESDFKLNELKSIADALGVTANTLVVRAEEHAA